MPAAVSPSDRLASLYKYRCYNVAWMFLVNFLGSFLATPAVLKHHNNYCSYADTIMPQFFFAVGFAMRLTFERRVKREGRARAYSKAVRRILGLALIAIVLYGAPKVARTWDDLLTIGWQGAGLVAMREWFQTLMHIAVTSLWVLPVIRARGAVRIALAAVSALLFTALSQRFYFEWVQSHGIDGGALGFLAWTLPVVTGTLACDMVEANRSGREVLRTTIAGTLMMLGGWLLAAGTTLYDMPSGKLDPRSEAWADDPVAPSAQRWIEHPLQFSEPPFVAPPAHAREENFWMMSQRAATISYHLFAAGLSLALFAAFRVACDYWGWQWGIFRTLGTNALAGYILHGIVGDAVEAFMPADSPAWYVAAGFLVYFAICYVILRWLEVQRIFIKL
jgi:predicted acyltransferase